MTDTATLETLTADYGAHLVAFVTDYTDATPKQIEEYLEGYLMGSFDSWEDFVSEVEEYYCDQDMESTLAECERWNVDTEGLTEDEIYTSLAEVYANQLTGAAEQYGWGSHATYYAHDGKEYIIWLSID